jgi:hypothetical protein
MLFARILDEGFMATCYICGVGIPKNGGMRREVNTGSSAGFTSRGTISGRTYYGLRTLYSSCATQLDRDRERVAARGRIQLIAVCIIGAVIWFLVHFDVIPIHHQ